MGSVILSRHRHSRYLQAMVAGLSRLSLAEERQSCVLFARKWHLLGGWAAELFDSARHVKQDESHLESLTLGPQWRF